MTILKNYNILKQDLIAGRNLGPLVKCSMKIVKRAYIPDASTLTAASCAGFHAKHTVDQLINACLLGFLLSCAHSFVKLMNVYDHVLMK